MNTSYRRKKKPTLYDEILTQVSNQLNERSQLISEVNWQRLKNNLKKIAIATAMGTSLLGGISAKAQVPVAKDTMMINMIQDTVQDINPKILAMTEKVKPGFVISTVKGPVGEVLTSTINTPGALDAVHSILSGAKRTQDFAKSVNAELKRLRSLGYNPDVGDIQIKTTVVGGKIITTSSCDIIQSEDNFKAYTVFTTRGSIGKAGSDYSQRHDAQISGLVGRLKTAYKGSAKQVGSTFHIKFVVNGVSYGYEQTFFVASTAEDDLISDALMKLTIKDFGKSSQDLPGIEPDDTNDDDDNMSPDSIDTQQIEGTTLVNVKGNSTTGITDAFALLGPKVEKDIQMALEKIGKGTLVKYLTKVNRASKDGPITSLEIEWKVSSAKGNSNSFTRRGNINSNPAIAIQDVNNQTSALVSRLESQGFEDVHIQGNAQLNGEPISLGKDSRGVELFWYDVPLLMFNKAKTVKESRLTLQEVRRLKTLAGIL